MNYDDNIIFDLSDNPFQFIGIPLASLQIDGVDWNNIKIKRNYQEEYKENPAWINLKNTHGLMIGYDRKSGQLQTIEIYADGYLNKQFVTYNGKLPKGISMLMSRSVVLSKLGKPTFSTISSHISNYFFPDEPPVKTPSYYKDIYRYGIAHMHLFYSQDEYERLYSIFLYCGSGSQHDGSERIITYPNQEYMPEKPKSNKLKQLFSHVMKFLDV
jgi:hypothetical protein